MGGPTTGRGRGVAMSVLGGTMRGSRATLDPVLTQVFGKAQARRKGCQTGRRWRSVLSQWRRRLLSFHAKRRVWSPKGSLRRQWANDVAVGLLPALFVLPFPRSRWSAEEHCSLATVCSPRPLAPVLGGFSGAGLNRSYISFKHNHAFRNGLPRMWT